VIIASFIAAGAWAPGRPAPSRSPCRAADSAAVVRVASRFHEILSTGDTAGLSALLAPDLEVIEAGSVENRQEYLANHLAADIEFAQAVKEKRTSSSYTCEGVVAWLISTSTSTGKFAGRDINNTSGELMLLSRTRDGWRIRAIHWSSAKRQPR
jgi:ketosteroid isomerase-like protein